jgi:hypothetical protein
MAYLVKGLILMSMRQPEVLCYALLCFAMLFNALLLHLHTHTPL